MRSRAVSVERIGVVALGLVCAAVLFSLATGFGNAVGLAAGGGFMLVNYRLIRTLVSRLITPGVSQIPAVGALVMKLGLTGILVLGVFYRFPVEPMSFAIGVSLLPLAAVLDATVLGTPLPEIEDEPDAGSDEI